MFNKTNKGFTLIELLIVIAIIAVLASVVIVSIGDQGGKADLAVAKAEAAQLRTLATLELNKDNPGAICSNSDVQKVINALGEDAVCVSGAAGQTNKNLWVVAFEAETDTFCIGDNSGVEELDGEVGASVDYSANLVKGTLDDANGGTVINISKCSSIDPASTTPAVVEWQDA